jgi:prepilin-type N-terminal cleavage/methylation domain-containing protein
MMRLRGRRTRGFSLIEIAIVLVVVGLIVSGGLLGISPVLQANKVTQTNTQLDKIEQTLVLYVIQNGCLPCPGDATAATLAGANAGQSEATGAVYYSTGCHATCQYAQGLVPWVSLGLARTDVTDPFGSFIDYVVATGLTGSTTMQRTPPSTYPTATTSLQVQNTAAVAQTQANPNGAAYVLISHGPDGSYGYAAANGTLRTDPNGGAKQTLNEASGTAAPNAVYVQDTPQGAASANGFFDDIVRFRTAPVIIQLCGSNACGNPA